MSIGYSKKIFDRRHGYEWKCGEGLYYDQQTITNGV